jgi:hypothetical protein
MHNAYGTGPDHGLVLTSTRNLIGLRALKLGQDAWSSAAALGRSLPTFEKEFLCRVEVLHSMMGWRLCAKFADTRVVHSSVDHTCASGALD